MKLESYIKRFLRNKDWVSTYTIAKKLNISWETANRHLYRMLANNSVERKVERRYGYKRVMWRLVKNA